MPSTYEDLVKNAHLLLRSQWSDATALAEQIYALIMPGIGTDIPEEAAGGAPSPAIAEVQRRLEQAQQFFGNIDQSTNVNFNRTTTITQQGLERTTPPQPPALPPPARTEDPPILKPIEIPGLQRLPEMPFPTIPPLFNTSSPGLPPQTSPPFSPANPVVNQPMSYSRPDLIVPPLPDVDWSVPINPVKPFQIDEGGGGILGKITGGSGNKYKADLYENGANSAATQSNVTVLIPQIDETDTIPEGTWVAPVIQVTNDIGEAESWYQPPIWLA